MFKLNPTKMSTTELRWLKTKLATLQDELISQGCNENDRICDSCPYDRVCQFISNSFITTKKELQERGVI